VPSPPPAIAALARKLEHELRCVECGATSPPDDPVGWRSYLTVDDETAVYCPACADREFGEREEASWSRTGIRSSAW
jgi:hypothetical protein